MKNIAFSFLRLCLRSVYRYYRRKQVFQLFRRMYKKDILRYLKHSRTLGKDNPEKMIGAIILQYHVIEKGLTMPESRLGFGKDRIISLSQDCIDYINKYGKGDEQVRHAIGVILEYEHYHKTNSYQLDSEVINAIKRLKSLNLEGIRKSSQVQTTREMYFKNINSSFIAFSNSRSSVRNYSTEDLQIIKIQKALELARNTPSACNRQSWRTYVYSDKQTIVRLLDAQGGNRGFGHLAHKLIIITGELGLFCYTNERNQVYIDGGMYAMNLLYALHNNEVAACILNCSFDHEKEQEIKVFGKIKDSEVLIAMITCGVAPSEFNIAASPRYSIGKTNTIVN